MSDPLKQSALDYHEFPQPGKLGITITKPFDTPAQLSLAYTPGVAEPVRAIQAGIPKPPIATPHWRASRCRRKCWRPMAKSRYPSDSTTLFPSRSIPVCANVSLNRWPAPR